jgi:hypothetical protein
MCPQRPQLRGSSTRLASHPSFTSPLQFPVVGRQVSSPLGLFFPQPASAAQATSSIATRATLRDQTMDRAIKA